MKYFFLPLIIGLLTIPCFGEFPDLTKSFKNARFINKTEIDPFNKIMNFGSDDRYEVLEKQLIAHLGEGWEKADLAEEKAKASERLKKGGLKKPTQGRQPIAGEAMLLSEKYPGTKIRLTVFRSRVFKRKYAILLAIERKKKTKNDQKK